MKHTSVIMGLLAANLLSEPQYVPEEHRTGYTKPKPTKKEQKARKKRNKGKQSKKRNRK